MCLNVPDDLQRLPADVETNLFRIIQQSLTNIHRHSGSATAEISIKISDGNLAVVIRDEGKGIPEDKMNDLSTGGSLAGVGIAGMRERTREMQGTFEVESNATGTTIRVSIPVLAASLKSQSVAG